MNNSELKKKLDHHYHYFDRTQISPDPLEFLHKYKNKLDIEIAGIISSVFAYGNVKQINSTLEKIHNLMDYKPFQFVSNYSYKSDSKLFNAIKHRFYTSNDISNFFKILNSIYSSNNSLDKIFTNYFLENKQNLKRSISSFSNDLLRRSNSKTHGLTFMFPDPEKGSACKRMNLFLRWMVRKDELDYGIWQDIPTSKLIIPVDTHVAQICKRLKLTTKENVSWAMAEEITENLKKFDPDDPVKYDFAICHIGMRKLKF